MRMPWVSTNSINGVPWPARDLAPLRDHEREVLWLRYLEDLPVAEVGRRVGAPEPTVRVRLHRARLRLRAAVDAAEADARRARREPARRA